MPTAKRLPSGTWRIRVYDGKIDGRDHYTSFTGKTRKEAELKAAQYICEQNAAETTQDSITVKAAVSRYIDAKTGVLSPSTIRGYRQIEKTYLDKIGEKDIYTITSEDLQRFVSRLAMKVSPKTTANIYGLVASAIALFAPNRQFRVSTPKRVPPKRKSPSDSQIRALFEASEKDLKIAIALAAFGSLRRGEACALKYEDINGDLIHVHADIVQDENNKYLYKEIPKTSDSVRFVRVPQQVVSLIGSGSGFIIGCSPGSITSSFIRLKKKLNIDIRFHDLRHYYASIGAVLGVPDIYLSEFGGWRKGSGVLKAVYQNVIDNAASQYQRTMINHFDSAIFTKNSNTAQIKNPLDEIMSNHIKRDGADGNRTRVCDETEE